MDIIFSKLGIVGLWFVVLIPFTICIIIGLVVQWFAFFIIKIFNTKKPTVLKKQWLKHLEIPAIMLLPISIILRVISTIKTIGDAILISTGVLAALAAQKSIVSFVTGVQIAFMEEQFLESYQNYDESLF
ncbi:hypothetical protein [Thalassobellus suaedae]|uniref:Uncharacterized protein n=1 Tax=Thalassobellus suaedae TaxID=3074124 RepID=A0ABY9Y4C8_9FLAO|nr:hypothetical protein RHP49_02375 [Flavobacteriaceae bacterium HL-DH10]